MPYKVIAHRHPKNYGGRMDPFQTEPALVADEQGRLGVVHDSQRQFVPLSPNQHKEAMGQVLGEPHNWHRYPRSQQPDWMPGQVVKVGTDGSSYLDSRVPALSPGGGADSGADMGQDGPTLPAAGDQGDAGATDPTGEPLPGAGAGSNVLPELMGPARTAPRQQGVRQTMRGQATNKGEPFEYSLPLTTCVTCLNLQPRPLLQIKPCRLEADQIGYADFGFYMNNGGCPFYQFGMTLPPSAAAEDDDGGDGGDGGDAGDGPASPASAADADDTVQPGTFQMAESDGGAGAGGAGTGDDTPAQVRGALIQLLGGHVTGLVSQNVALVGQPTTTDDESDEAGDEPDEAGDGDAEATPAGDGTGNDTKDEGAPQPDAEGNTNV